MSIYPSASLPSISILTPPVMIDASTTPAINNAVTVDFTAGIANIAALQLNVDMAGFNNTHAIESHFTATDMTTGDEAHIYDAHIVIPVSATGGDLAVLAVDRIGAGTADVSVIEAYPGVGILEQHTGAVVAVEKAWTYSGVVFTDATTAFGSAGTDVQIFVNDTDYIYFGHAAKFSTIEATLAIVASGAGIKPTFEFSIGGSGWTVFNPSDGTNGFRQNGNINWDSNSLVGWVVDTVNGVASKYWVRIRRTQVSLATVPTEDTLKIVVGTTFSWNKLGDLSVNKITTLDSVGIGVSTPAFKLDISSTGPADTLRIASTALGGQSRLVIEGGTGGFGQVENKVGEFYITNAASAGDILIRAGSAVERMRILSTGEVGIGTATPTAKLDVNSDTIRLRTAKTPALAAATGNAGDIVWDADYIYVCVATNMWKRTALTTW